MATGTQISLLQLFFVIIHCTGRWFYKITGDFVNVSFPPHESEKDDTSIVLLLYNWLF